MFNLNLMYFFIYTIEFSLFYFLIFGEIYDKLKKRKMTIKKIIKISNNFSKSLEKKKSRRG